MLAMRRLLLICALASTAPALPCASAQPCGAGGDLAKGTIAAVDARFDVVLDDGRRLTLSSLAPPRDAARRFSTLALERLRQAIAPAIAQAGAQAGAQPGARAVFWRALGEADRWGRTPALIFDGEGRRVDELLLAEGVFMLAANPGDCAEGARAAEASARAGRLGLWGDPDLAAVRADAPIDWSTRAGQLIVIEGTIDSIGQGRSRSFLNLGPGRGAPALVIAKRRWREFAQAGLDQSRLIGRRVLARGVVELERGMAESGATPTIELFHPAQIDVMEETQPTRP